MSEVDKPRMQPAANLQAPQLELSNNLNINTFSNELASLAGGTEPCGNQEEIEKKLSTAREALKKWVGLNGPVAKFLQSLDYCIPDLSVLDKQPAYQALSSVIKRNMFEKLREISELKKSLADCQSSREKEPIKVEVPVPTEKFAYDPNRAYSRVHQSMEELSGAKSPVTSLEEAKALTHTLPVLVVTAPIVAANAVKLAVAAAGIGMAAAPAFAAPTVDDKVVAAGTNIEGMKRDEKGDYYPTADGRILRLTNETVPVTVWNHEDNTISPSTNPPWKIFRDEQTKQAYVFWTSDLEKLMPDGNGYVFDFYVPDGQKIEVISDKLVEGANPQHAALSDNELKKLAGGQ